MRVWEVVTQGCNFRLVVCMKIVDANQGIGTGVGNFDWSI